MLARVPHQPLLPPPRYLLQNFPLSIQCASTGVVFMVPVTVVDTIANVKAQIQALLKVPVQRQLLKFGGTYLRDELALKDYNIQSNSHLRLLKKRPLPRPVMISIYVWCMFPSQFQYFKLNIPAAGSIGWAKARIQERLGCPIDNQRLIFGGRILCDNTEKLSDVGIREGCLCCLQRSCQTLLRVDPGRIVMPLELLHLVSWEAVDRYLVKVFKGAPDISIYIYLFFFNYIYIDKF